MAESTIAIKAGRILTPTESIEPGLLIVKGERLVAVGSPESVHIPPKSKVIEADDKIVAPGFIDVHIHGWGGLCVGDSSDAAREVAKSIVSSGTTSFLPTVANAPELEQLLVAIRAIRGAIEQGTNGAEILGINVEGPYLSSAETARGSISLPSMRRPSVSELYQLVEESHGTIRVICIAPELDGALDVIREMVSLNIVPSAAHSAATYEQATEAVKAGLGSATHTFNGMIPMHHRNPGLIGAVLTLDEVNAELIADAVHVSPVAMKVLLRCKGTGGVTLTTDNTYLAGMPDGNYEKPDGRKVIKKDSKAWVVGGTLTGSVVPMNKDVRNIVDLVGYPLAKAIEMASLNPAKLIGVVRRKGDLVPGKDADLTIIDEEVNVYLTMVKGREVYRAEP